MQTKLPSKREIKKLLHCILTTEDVKGVILFSFQGEIIFEEFLSPPPVDPHTKARWGLFVESLKGIREADLLFEKSRLYIRRIEHGYLFVLMGVFAPIAMLRLNCDTLLPNLTQMGKIKRLTHFFAR